MQIHHAVCALNEDTTKVLDILNQNKPQTRQGFNSTLRREDKKNKAKKIIKEQKRVYVKEIGTRGINAVHFIG